MTHAQYQGRLHKGGMVRDAPWRKLEWIELVNFLSWSRFLITVSSPACIIIIIIIIIHEFHRDASLETKLQGH